MSDQISSIFDLPPDEQEFIELYRALTPAQRHATAITLEIFGKHSGSPMPVIVREIEEVIAALKFSVSELTKNHSKPELHMVKQERQS